MSHAESKKLESELPRHQVSAGIENDRASSSTFSAPSIHLPWLCQGLQPSSLRTHRDQRRLQHHRLQTPLLQTPLSSYLHLMAATHKLVRIVAQPPRAKLDERLAKQESKPKASAPGYRPLVTEKPIEYPSWRVRGFRGFCNPRIFQHALLGTSLI